MPGHDGCEIQAQLSGRQLDDVLHQVRPGRQVGNQEPSGCGGGRSHGAG